MPETRQTLLFSATMPKLLVDFVRAGLKDPLIVRLDAESKVSELLQMVYITVKPDEKIGALLYLLREVRGCNCAVLRCSYAHKELTGDP